MSFNSDERLNRGDVVVGVDEGKMAYDEAILVTRGLQCCIGIAIYDPISTNGYLSHVHNSEASHIETALPMSEIATCLSANQAQLRAWARGGSLQTSPGSESHEVDLGLREKTVNLLSSIGITGSRLDVSWNDEPLLPLGMSLNCSDGKLVCNNPSSWASLGDIWRRI